MADCIWKDLSEVAFLKRGIVISKDFLRDNYGIYPVYSSQTIDDGIMGYINTFMFDGEFLTWTTDGANAGTIFHRKGKFNITNVCGLIEIKDDTVIKYRFLYFWLSYIAKQYVLEGMGNPKLMSNRMGLIKIPLPHIKVQEEIVKILDSFTNLIDALNEELSLRQKQFEYYREKLLTFDDTTDSVYIIPQRGVRVVKSDLDDTNTFPVYQNSIAALGYYDKANRRANLTFVICAGAAGEVGYSTIDFWAADDCFTMEHKKLMDKFIYYLISNKKTYLKSQVRKASIPRLSNAVIAKLNFPCPSLDIQQSIVEKLDAFESLISSLKEEIALRQKQYEYYREKLLTFE